MASQPPIQYNQTPASIPNAAGLSRPPLLQPNTSNGMGTQPAASAFPLPSTLNFAPPFNNTASSQWARPPITGQGSISSPISQSSSSSSSQQQFNPAIYGPNSSRPALPVLNSGRPPGPSAINPIAAGIMQHYIFSTLDHNNSVL